jgi:hypothetical protein
MLDEEDDENINPMETEAGATLNEEYELMEPTHRELEYELLGRTNVNPYKNFVVNADITNRSHYMGNDEDFAEGTQQLPMESPAGAGKFMSRTRMYLNEFIANHMDESHVKRSL